MGISRLLAVAAVLASAATSSPIARRVVDDEPLSFNPGGPMKPATPTASDARVPFNPGGPMISATPTRHHNHHQHSLPPQTIREETVEEDGEERIWTPRSPKEEPRGISPGVDDTQAQPSMSINMPPIFGGSGGGGGGRKHSYQTGAAGPPPFWPANPSRPQTRQAEGNDTSVANGLCPYTLPLPTSTAANPCSWNGVMTVWPSITTSTRLVDCGGCAELSISHRPIHCPMQLINATQSVSTASTSWVTACSPTAVPTPATHTRMAQGPNVAVAPLPTAPALPGAGAAASTLATAAPQWPPAGTPPWPTQFPQRPTGAGADGGNSPPWPTQFPRPTGPDGNPWTGGGFGPFTPGGGGLPPNPFTNMPPGFSPQGGFPFGLPPFFMPGGGCFTPFLVPPHFTGGRTATEYQEVRTSVCDLQCNGCALTTSLAKMAYGQPVRFHTTVTKPYSYTTVYRCAK